EILRELERRRGVEEGSVEIVVMLGTAQGVWNIREIISACARVTTIGLDESHLLLDLGFLPDPEEDPFQHYIRGRVVIEAAGVDERLHGHQGAYRLGIGYPLSSYPSVEASADEVFRAARRAKELGFNGAICPVPAWV